MVKILKNIADLVGMDKKLGRRPSWDEDSDPRYSKFIAPLEIIGSTMTGFELRAYVSKQWADRDAMLQMEYAPLGRRNAIELWRIDWRRFHSHINKGRPKDCPFETFDGSHHHPFVDNYIPQEERMLAGSLPAARAISNDPNTLSNFLAFCGKLFKIKDIDLIKLPSINGDLFWEEYD